MALVPKVVHQTSSDPGVSLKRISDTRRCSDHVLWPSQPLCKQQHLHSLHQPNC